MKCVRPQVWSDELFTIAEYEEVLLEDSRLTGELLRRSHKRLFNHLGWRRVQRMFDLTPREIQVVIMYCKGLRTIDIAKYLGIKRGTVKAHQRTLFGKVRVKNARQLMLKCILATGCLLPDDEPGSDIDTQ